MKKNFIIVLALCLLVGCADKKQEVIDDKVKYTFEQESDGLYKYISRTKVS